MRFIVASAYRNMLRSRCLLKLPHIPRGPRNRGTEHFNIMGEIGNSAQRASNTKKFDGPC
jgi:hypothetical protein